MHRADVALSFGTYLDLPVLRKSYRKANAKAALTGLLFFLWCHAIAAQDLYKWTDEEGNVHYGDKPPASVEAQTSTTKVDTGVTPNTIVKVPVTVDTSETAGITRHVLYANELLSSHSSMPSRMIFSDGTLWLPFRDSVLSFDPYSRQSIKYRLDRIPTNITVQRMHVSGNSFIFLSKDRHSTESTFHVYDHTRNSHVELAVATTPTTVLLYDDKYGDGIFGYSFQSKSLIQFPNVLDDREGTEASEIEWSPAGDVGSIYGLTVSRNAIWYISGYKKACSTGFFDKQSKSTRHFDNEETGGSSSNGCSSIVADDREAWITSLDPGGAGTTFSIYDLNSGEWSTLKKDKDDPGSYAVLLQMDRERIYFTKCEKLFAIDRESKRTTSYTLDGPDRIDQRNYCVSIFEVHDGHIWALKFEEHDRRRYPVLYKIPLVLLTQ